MSQTKSQRKKIQKKVARRKAHVKCLNIEHNLAPLRFRWDIFHEGTWIEGFKTYRKWAQVQKKLDETEELRKEGHEIMAGRIIDMVLREVAKEIDPSPAKVKGKGELPDKMEDDPKTAAKAIIGLK